MGDIASVNGGSKRPRTYLEVIRTKPDYSITPSLYLGKCIGWLAMRKDLNAMILTETEQKCSGTTSGKFLFVKNTTC